MLFQHRLSGIVHGSLQLLAAMLLFRLCTANCRFLLLALDFLHLLPEAGRSRPLCKVCALHHTPASILSAFLSMWQQYSCTSGRVIVSPPCRVGAYWDSCYSVLSISTRPFMWSFAATAVYIGLDTAAAGRVFMQPVIHLTGSSTTGDSTIMQTCRRASSNAT